MTNGWAPTQQEIIEFLRSQTLGVLSTIGPLGEPQAATIAFSEHSGLYLVVGTAVGSRKYVNLARDPRVAMTVTDPDKRFTMQYQGEAELLSMEALKVYEPQHYAKLPSSLPFKDLPGQAFYLITPTQVRFSDCNPDPWLVTIYEY